MPMQACRAYYNDGRFVPLGFGKLPEGTPAIITLLEETPDGIDERFENFEKIMQLIDNAVDEEMPPIENIKFRGANI